LPEKNKNILIISYFFPPMGLGGVQRAAKTAKYMARMGWNVFVLTSDYNSYPVKDFSLLEDIPSSVKIIRIKDPLTDSPHPGQADNYITPGRSEFWRRLTRLPDTKIFWSNKIRDIAEKIVSENEIKYLLTTSPPPSLHSAGVYLRKKYQLRWLADFRDPWLADDLPDITPLHSYMRNQLENDIIKSADNISVVTTTHRHDLKSRFPDCKNKIVYIPNGYDPHDFSEKASSLLDKMVITHCGTLCSKFSVLAFFESLTAVLSKNEKLRDKIKFVQIGNVNEDLYQGLDHNYSGQINIEYTGYLEHTKAVRKILQSSAVVVFSGISPTLELNLPGKLYEALASERPCLAVFKKHSPAREILTQMPGVFLLDPDDIESSADILREFVEQYQAGTLEKISRQSMLSKYSRKNQTEQIAHLLENR